MDEMVFVFAVNFIFMGITEKIIMHYTDKTNVI